MFSNLDTLFFDQKHVTKNVIIRAGKSFGFLFNNVLNVSVHKIPG